MIVARQRKRNPRIEIIPMIDVIFFLLVFFMLFTTFRTDPMGMQVDLPRGASITRQEPSELVITVTQAGETFLNGEAMTGAQVQSAVRSAVSRRPDTMVIVRGDRDAHYRHVFRAMDLARAAGAFRIGLSAEPGRD